MGKRGPKPTPTAALARRGSWRAKERQGEPEPTVAGRCPAPPARLKGVARREWIDRAPTLWAAHLLTDADLPAFEHYCVTFAFWLRVSDQFAKAPDTAIGKDDAATLKMADEMLRRARAAFGMTPADRADLHMEPKNGDDAKEKFLEGPRLVG